MAEVKEIQDTALEAAADETDDSMVIRFKKPYVFEKNTYTEIDLNGLNDINTNDLISVASQVRRAYGMHGASPEVTMEYACTLAARASQLPVEFFLQLPACEGIKIKNRVINFLF